MRQTVRPIFESAPAVPPEAPIAAAVPHLPLSSPTHRPLAVVLLVALAVAAILLFARLGHYALWDDESFTALSAQAILATGDTSARVGQNYVACYSGRLLVNGADRATPPLPAYLTAPFIAVLGPTSLAARLPFAIAGLVLCIAAAAMAWRLRVSASLAATGAVIALSNVSFFLFWRNSRYYALAILGTAAAAWCYLQWSGRRRLLPIATAGMFVVLASNYMSFFALAAALVADYLIWGRHRQRLTFRDWLTLLLPLAIAALPIVMIWNPLRTAMAEQLSNKTWYDALELWLLTFRDLNAAEFAPLVLLIAAPIAGWLFKQSWLIRATLAAAIYVLVVSFLSPQTLRPIDPPGPRAAFGEAIADIRYVTPLLPLLMLTAGGVVWMGCRRLRVPSILIPLVAAIVFGFAPLNRALVGKFAIECTPWKFARELITPPAEPYAPTAEFLKTNVPAGSLVWVTPRYAVYPLMFHAPGAVYGWQFYSPYEAKAPADMPWQIAGKQPPDYIVAFGPGGLGDAMRPNLFPPGVTYQLVQSVPIFFKDLYRPELFWRTFVELPCDVTRGGGVYIFKRAAAVPAPPPPPATPANDFRL